ncbi:hypothetical protein BIU88_09720 [Chlorobaculum limnaeum]|uniref:Uncharacterized protein n=1 Tax=Chlorobaculum limnaeum TaxID=274537 RepID=A0A1D8D2F3_CHLLM|nr:hypothetical protein [Chlorobaculum limnaeum]AOS84383.1 hypothetical protein BIU88_09720 [Chlorobaculum limnaeum]
MKKHEDQREKWEFIGHRLMESSDLQMLCGVTRKTAGAEKPFVACLHDHELKGMITFVLERMREIDKRAESAAARVREIPYEYRDRQQEYLRLQVPKGESYRSSELYNADFINDLDEGFNTLQGVFVTLTRALSYLFEELGYRHGIIDASFMQALHRNYPEYAGIIGGLMGEKPNVESTGAHRDAIKLTLTADQFAELLSCLEVFFDPADRAALKTLLQGQTVSQKLVFNGNQNQLVEVFRRLSYNGLLHESWTSLREWLFGHFAYRSKTGVANLSKNSVWDILSKAKGEPAGRSRICSFDWLPYSTQAGLRKSGL